MLSIEIRIAMSKEGWHSEEQITDIGFGDKTGFKCFFSRYNWHGKFTDSICFSKITTDLTKTHECVVKTANLAKTAWNEFPNSVPFVSADGVLMEDEFKTRLWRDSPTLEAWASLRQQNRLEKELRDIDKIQLTHNQYWDMKTLYDNKGVFNGQIHRIYCRSGQDEMQELVEMGLVEYIDQFRYGRLLLKLSYLGCSAVQCHNITTRQP